MVSYLYSPLNEGLKEIRLLTLQPGEFSADLRISIHKVELVPEAPPIYEALSYVWGTTGNPIDIRVGPPGQDTLTITRNLAIALPYLRYTDRARILWIDAVCINQQNLGERSSQVKMMGDIYHLADRVVVWLGTAENYSTRVMSLLWCVGSKIKIDPATLSVSPADAESDPQWSDPISKLPFDRQDLHIIDAFLHRPWFSRLWIWQEIRNAKENAIIVCGKDCIPWWAFRQAIFCMAFKPPPSNIPGLDFHRLSVRLNQIRCMSDSINFNELGHTIRTSSFCGCSDPRDRIYAFLSLREKVYEGIKIEPDYTKTTEQVYQDLILKSVENPNMLQLIRHCDLQSDGSAVMPTWIPNWDLADTATPPCGNGRASGGSIAKVVHKGDGVLSVTGVISATISNAKEINFQDNRVMAVINEIRRLAPSNFEDETYISGGSLIDALVSALCTDLFSDSTWPPVILLLCVEPG